MGKAAATVCISKQLWWAVQVPGNRVIWGARLLRKKVEPIRVWGSISFKYILASLTGVLWAERNLTHTG